MSNDDLSLSGNPDRGAGAFGCIFCKTGAEKRIAREIERDFPCIRALFAEKLRRRRKGRGYEEERVPLFPGYLFFYADAELEARRIAERENVYRLLHGPDETWRLQGADEAFARRLFDQAGVVGFSRAYFEGERIRIADGPLKKYEGQILRVNRRAQTAQIRVDFCGREVTVWLGFELMENE